jgi:alginate O-acetyltransferase complex protein AlgJ
MTLLTAARRRLGLVVLAALTLPILALPFVRAETTSKQENRRLAAAPATPRAPEAWRALPRQLDAYLADHFAFREAMILGERKVDQAIGARTGRRSPSDAAAATPMSAMGQDGRMFLVEGLLQSTGRQLNPIRTADYADFVCEAQTRLSARGIKLLASMAPSPGEILPDKVPAWAGPAKRPTDYDAILGRLSACGVSTTDLRPPLIAASVSAKTYRKTDTHWTERGAMIAYSQMVKTMGRPDWVVSPSDITWGQIIDAGGDLPRMAGLEPIAEPLEVYPAGALPPGASETYVSGLTLRPSGQEQPPYAITMTQPGPSVLIIGDSYTSRAFFPPLFARFAGRVTWIHMDQCAFDWRVVDRVRPDYVLIIPAEREAFCDGARPWKTKAP